MGYLIVEKKGSNFLSGDDATAFTNHIGHALVIEDAGEARAMLKALRKTQPDTAFSLLEEVE